MISHSATTEALTFPDSIGIEPGSIYHTRIVIETEEEQPKFNPLEVLNDTWNKQLYALFTKSRPGYFVAAASELLATDKDVLLVIEKQGLLPAYYLYSMEYMFSVLKWAPKGVRR